MQRRMADKLGVKPGAELLAAVTTAKEVGAHLVLADREVAITLKRCWSKLGTANRAQLLLTLGVSLFAKVEISAEQVEQLKGKDTMGELMKEFATHMPELQLPLIEERDRFLMSHAREAPGKCIVAVVGAAHVPGMVAVLDQPVDRAKLSEIPAVTTWSKLRPWVIPLFVIGNVLAVHALGIAPTPNDLARAWVVPCSVAATLGALFGGASPLTLLGTLLTAPFIALNPSARKAQVASWLEALWRRPSEEDRSRLDAALSSLRQLRHNPFSRVLFVALGTQVGTVLGAIVGCVWVLLVCWG
jgi:pheromone shutdown-related protein TraB